MAPSMDHPLVEYVAATIQRAAPDLLLVNEFLSNPANDPDSVGDVPHPDGGKPDHGHGHARGVTVNGIDFLGEVAIATGTQFGGTEIGGLSGITYDRNSGQFYVQSDARGSAADGPARFYTVTVDLSDGTLDPGDVGFRGVTFLVRPDGTPFPPLSLDPESIALTDDGKSVFISSEGDANALIDPFVARFSLSGTQRQSFKIPQNFLPTADGSSGIRNNLAFESLTLTPDGRHFVTATENALLQDGPAAALGVGSPSRMLVFDTRTGEPTAEYVYETDPIVAAPVPAGAFANNGLAELLALDNSGDFLALERAFSTGGGNSIRLYQVSTKSATDVSRLDALGDATRPIVPVEKELLLDFDQLGVRLDNVEGMTLGPTLPDGRQSLVLVSDNNFSTRQETQFLAFALNLDTSPGPAPDDGGGWWR